MMKHIKYYISIIALMLIMAACERQIYIDIVPAEPRLVIDAVIEQGSRCFVALSKTQNIEESELILPISGAKIVLTNNLGEKETLIADQYSHVYMSDMMGEVGVTYTLDVTYEDKTYSATEKLPSIVEIDSLYVFTIPQGNKNINYPCFNFQDPKNEKNFYLYSMKLNDRHITNVSRNSDEYNNGLTMESILYFDKDDDNFGEELKAGDKIFITFQNVNEATYEFYRSMNNSGNPISNFSGNVLGLFKASTTTYYSGTILKEHMPE